MKLLIDRISRLCIDWNERPLTENDFYNFCKKHKVTVAEMPLSVSGFYYCVLGKHYIAIDSKLPQPQKLFVMFHEFAHFLLHAPDSGSTANFHGIGRKTRKECEADAFALCALIPKSFIECRSIAELIEIDGIPETVLNERVQLLEKHGI